MPTTVMQRHADYDPDTTVNIGGITGMVEGDRVYDTTTGIPQYRSAGAAWERYTVVLNGQVAHPDGLAATPSITFDSELTMGFYRQGPFNVSLSVAGVEQIRFSDGVLSQAGAVGTPAYSFLAEQNSGLYRVGAGAIGMSVGGALITQWGTRFAISGNRHIDFNAGFATIRGLGGGLSLQLQSTTYFDFNVGIENDPNTLTIDDAPINIQTLGDTPGGAVYISTRAGGVATGVGQAGGLLAISAGDGSDAAVASGLNGGVGGTLNLVPGTGGAGDGAGVAGADGQILIGVDGTVAVPAIAFSSNTDFGILFDPAAAGGTGRMDWSTNSSLQMSLQAGAWGGPSVWRFVEDTDTLFRRQGANQIGVETGGTERMRWDGGGIVFIGDGTTTTNANMTIGWTVQQNANDDEAGAFKSTDVAHGMTSLTETDTYGFISKLSGVGGGLLLRAFADADAPDGRVLVLSGTGSSASTSKSTVSTGAVALQASVKSGVSEAAIGADGNLVVIRNLNTTTTIFDAEGTLHLDLGGNGTNAAPSLTFAGDVDTGFYQPYAGGIRIAAAGVSSTIFDSAGISIPDGLLTNPSIKYLNDVDTGIYRPGTDRIGVVVGGNPVVLGDAAITLAAAADTAGGDIFSKVEDGGTASGATAGFDGADLTETAGDGSAAGGGVNVGGDGGDRRIQSGVGGAGAGGGAAGADGLVYIEKSDNTGFWDDLRIVPGAFQFAGASDPTLSAWQPTGAGATFQVYEFDTGDEVFFTCQIPHSYLEGSDLKPHIHWTPRARGVAENGNTVNWRLDYSIANPNANFGASATINLTDTCNGVNERHEVTDSGTISGTGVTMSAMLVCRVYRLAGDTWSLNTAGNRPVLLEFDIHFQTNSNGSRAETSK